MYPIYYLLVTLSPKFQSVALYCQPFFGVSSPFETSVPNDPKMTLNTTGTNVLHILPTSSLWVPNFIPFYCPASRF